MRPYGDIAGEWRPAGAVDNPAAANDDVVHRCRSSFLDPDFARSLNLGVSRFCVLDDAPAQRGRNALHVIPDPCGAMDNVRKEPAYKAAFTVSSGTLATRT
jgi:hypothetical protein